MAAPQTVLITGATGDIGEACATLLATNGTNVAVHYHNNKIRAEDLCAQLCAYGVQAIPVQADIADEASVVQMFATLDQALPPLTGLVNNAAITATIQPFLEYTVERIQSVLNTNILGSFLCAREAIGRMAHSRGGAGGNIVNISSTATSIGSPHEYIDYAASKGAVEVFSMGLAKEFAEDGIRVNTVRPGLINTGLHQKSGDADRVRRLQPLIPMKRIGEPNEVAQAVAWLLSPHSSYSTGSTITVSGGR